MFPHTEIWATINSNFLDVAVLEWCKLFADGPATHNWRKVVVDRTSFLPQMLGDAKSNLSDWDRHVKSVKNYRDKFVAHLDQENMIDVPNLDLSEYSVHYLFDTIRLEQSELHFNDMPKSTREYLRLCHSQARDIYKAAV